MTDLTFDHLFSYAELTDALQGLAAAHPDLVELSSIGQSHEGRDIWLATITNRATGPHDEKPALFVEANIHATEITASTAALHLVHHLATGYGSNDAVTRSLDTRCFYVVPRLNPDGVELALAEPPTYLRSSTRIYPRPDQQPGLVEQDVDGDGRVLTMRLPDPNGSWKIHPDDARLLVPRALDEDGPGDYYRLLPEGIIHEYDGTLIPIAPPHRSLDLNRNFPQDWLPEGSQEGAGPFPTSEPEARALVEAVVARPNICAYIAYHTFSAVILRPYGGYADDHFPTADLRTYQALGKRATEITGYEAVSVFHDFKYDPKSSITGASDEWAYDHLGIFSWTTEFWSPIRAAGITGYKYIDWFDEHPVEDDLRLLRWNDDVLGGEGFVDWYPFDHPQLGRVDIGGWDYFRTWSNAPPSLMAAEVAPHSEWAVAHQLASPRLAVQSFTADPLGDGMWRLRLAVENTGWMPTNVSKKALERKAVRPVEAEVELPDGASLALGDVRQELGQLAGHARARQMLAMFDGGFDPTDDRAKAEWVVHAPPGATIRVTARHARAGTTRAELTLP
ncbi:MAG: M14 family metallopeptidase [Acidimicrobiia bacterium]